MTRGGSSGGIICFNPQYVIRDKNGKVWPFEFHPFCGPSVLTKKGNPWKRFPGEKAPFWEAFQAWFSGGRKVKEEGGQTWAVWP